MRKHGLLRRMLGEQAWEEYQKLRANEKTFRCNAKRGDAITRWRQRLKLKLIEYKGGKCERCGYDKCIPNAYAFHHKNPDEKEFGISDGIPRSFEKSKKEADKCVLLCLICHAEIHYADFQKTRERTLISYEQAAEKWAKLKEDFLREHLGDAAKPFIKTLRGKRSKLS